MVFCIYSYFLFTDYISSAKEKLSKTITMYQKDKAHSDQKVDLLILKVEDLEVIFFFLICLYYEFSLSM